MNTVVVTPAGRRKYMEVLAPRLLADPDVTRWELWLNTDHPPDIDWVRSLAAAHPEKVRVVEIPEPVGHPVAYRIHKFYRTACDVNSVYVRMDDDIVWYAPGSISSLVHHRCVIPHHFLVYGNVLNSGLTSHLHQRFMRIPLDWGRVKYLCMDEVAWGNPQFAEKLHRAFLADPKPENWHIPDWVLYDYERHSVNVISWHGADCARWHPHIGHDEEVELSVIKPQAEGRMCAIHGAGLFVHFAFYTQRDHLDATNILDCYRRLP
jgi:hypothetical protein